MSEFSASPFYRSAPGTPCLYLAISSFLCWLEAGRPSHNTFNVCGFKPNKKLNILDLSCAAEDLLEDINYYTHEQETLTSRENLAPEYEERLAAEVPKMEREIPLKIKKFLHTHLIAMACGVKVKEHNERNRAFKEEYIIPQLLLQSLLQNQIDGIKYISTNVYVSAGEKARNRFINYAFPAKGNDSELISCFLSSPVINAASCQGVNSLREDIREISEYLSDMESSLRGFGGASFARLPSRFGEEMMPYSSGSGGFAYYDSVFGEIEVILRNALKSRTVKAL